MCENKIIFHSIITYESFFQVAKHMNFFQVAKNVKEHFYSCAKASNGPDLSDGPEFAHSWFSMTIRKEY